jgi:hypothetical protein
MTSDEATVIIGARGGGSDHRRDLLPAGHLFVALPSPGRPIVVAGRDPRVLCCVRSAMLTAPGLDLRRRPGGAPGAVRLAAHAAPGGTAAPTPAPWSRLADLMAA